MLFLSSQFGGKELLKFLFLPSLCACGALAQSEGNHSSPGTQESTLGLDCFGANDELIKLRVLGDDSNELQISVWSEAHRSVRLRVLDARVGLDQHKTQKDVFYAFVCGAEDSVAVRFSLNPSDATKLGRLFQVNCSAPLLGSKPIRVESCTRI